jgi:hypothetical protein
MSNLTKLDHEELRAALAEHQHDLLEACAKETGLPSDGWTAVPGLLLLAKIWATDQLTAQLVDQLIDDLDPSVGRYTEETARIAAERSLFRDGAQPATPPRPGRTRGAWLRACQ